MKCIDLKTLGKFRIEHESGKRGRDDLWLLVIPCRHGHIYPHGGDRLGFASRCRGPVANKVAALPGARIEQEAGDGLNVSFPVEMFGRVARIVGAKRQRTMTAEQRTAAAERLARFRFPTADNGHTLPPSGRSDGVVGVLTPPRRAV